MPPIPFRDQLLRLYGALYRGSVDTIMLPNVSRHDDVYLASFPKAGNTWLTFLLANVQIIHLGLDEEVNFFNSRRYVPDLHQSRSVPGELRYPPFPRFLKIHSRHVTQYNKAILIVRDPRECLVSFWKFSKALYGYRRDLSAFVRDRRSGIAAWARHTNSWVRDKPPGVRLHIVKYEDLRENTERELSTIIRKIGIHVKEETLGEAVRRATFEEMQRLEEETNSDLLDPRGYRFVRKAEVDSFESEMSSGDQAYVARVAGEPMRYFGYL